MKKKFFVGITAAALAAMMCVAFTGCGGVDAKSVKGVEVTAEQWDAAFAVFEKDDAQYTAKVSMEYSTTLNIDTTLLGGEKKSGTISQSTQSTYVNNGTKQSAKGETKISSSGDFSFDELKNQLGIETDEMKDGTTEIEMYAEKGELTYTLYNKDADGKWTTRQGSSIIPTYYFALKGKFEDYKYDETLKGYVEKDYTEASKEYTVYKFNKDGELVAIYDCGNEEDGVEALNMSATNEMNIVISYKAEEINLPALS